MTSENFPDKISKGFGFPDPGRKNLKVNLQKSLYFCGPGSHLKELRSPGLPFGELGRTSKVQNAEGKGSQKLVPDLHIEERILILESKTKCFSTPKIPETKMIFGLSGFQHGFRFSGFCMSGWNFEGFALRFPYVWMEFRRFLASQAAFRRSRTLKCGAPIWPNLQEIGSELANPIGKEIGSELANPIGKEIGSDLANPIGKSAPIWIPESCKEIGSNLDTGIPQENRLRFAILQVMI
ncbi:unnamed protein product [Rhizophagus irregularis]|nr:unnamed protein product [Rhizophagus irregularis]CAB4434552.1 unnamed protein product [Rhizophagus irregularis]